MRSLSDVARTYHWQPNEYHFMLERLIPPMAIYGIFSSAQFNPYGKKKMFIVLAELHTFEAAKHWLPQLQEIFAPRIVELHPPFIRDRVKNQYRGRSKVYTGWTPPPRKKLTPEMRAGQKARLDTLVGGAEGLIYRIGTI